MAELSYDQMAAACDQIGIKMVSDDTCLKLLALVYVYGDESAVYSDTMCRDIQQACNRFSIRGGGKPTLNRTAFRAYVDQLEAGQALWLEAIEKRYNVKFPRMEPKAGPDVWKELLHGGIRLSEGQHGKAGQ